MLRCLGAWMHVWLKTDVFFCFCICYYFCICICVYIWFVFIVLCIVCICGTQLLVCRSDQYLASDAPGVATHYWLDRHICVDSDDDEVLVWKLEALAGMILVKLGLGLSQGYLKTWGSTLGLNERQTLRLYRNIWPTDNQPRLATIITELEFVHAVSAGGSLKFLPAM